MLVSSAGRDQDRPGDTELGCGVLGEKSGGLGSGKDRRQHREPVARTGGDVEDVGQPRRSLCVEISRTRGVGAIGDSPTGEAEGQVVVREKDASSGVEHRRFVLGNPGELRDGERRGGQRSDASYPRGAADRLDQFRQLFGAGGVVPELGGPEGFFVCAEEDEAVALCGDADCGDLGLAGCVESSSDCKNKGVPP